MTPMDMIFAAILQAAEQKCEINYQYSAIVLAAIYVPDKDDWITQRKLAETKSRLKKLCGKSKWEKGEK